MICMRSVLNLVTYSLKKIMYVYIPNVKKEFVLNMFITAVCLLLLIKSKITGFGLY